MLIFEACALSYTTNEIPIFLHMDKSNDWDVGFDYMAVGIVHADPLTPLLLCDPNCVPRVRIPSTTSYCARGLSSREHFTSTLPEDMTGKKGDRLVWIFGCWLVDAVAASAPGSQSREKTTPRTVHPEERCGCLP